MDATGPLRTPPESTPFDHSRPSDATPSGATPRVRRGPGPKRRWRSLKVADSYLLGEVVTNTLRGLSWFGGLLLAFAVMTAVRYIVSDRLTFGSLLQYLIFQMPRIFLFTLPMSLLFGVVQTFSDLSTRGEMTALSAGGMSFRRMLYAPLGWALALAIFAFFVQEGVVPWAEQRKTEVLKAHIVESLKTQDQLIWIEQRDDGSMQRVVQADSFNPKTATLFNPSIQIWNDRRQIALEIQAETARWDDQRKMWHLIKPTTSAGHLSNLGDNTESFQTDSAETWLQTDQVPAPMAFREDPSSREKILEKQDFEMVSFNDVVAYRARQQAALQQIRDKKLRDNIETTIRGATYGLHDKISTPLVCLALVLVGAPLGVRPMRSSGGFSMGLSLAVLLVYYLLWSAMEQLGKGGIAPPIPAAYLPFALTTIVGLLLVRNKSQ